MIELNTVWIILGGLAAWWAIAVPLGYLLGAAIERDDDLLDGLARGLPVWPNDDQLAVMLAAWRDEMRANRDQPPNVSPDVTP